MAMHATTTLHACMHIPTLPSSHPMLRQCPPNHVRLAPCLQEIECAEEEGEGGRGWAKKGRKELKGRGDCRTGTRLNKMSTKIK